MNLKFPLVVILLPFTTKCFTANFLKKNILMRIFMKNFHRFFKASIATLLLGLSCFTVPANTLENIRQVSHEENNFDDVFSKEKFLSAHETIEEYVVKTPLVALPRISAKTGKMVYLKDESRQRGSSFKTRGVTYEVFKTIEEVIVHNPKLLEEGLQIVTQTDGNHGVALILAVTSAIEKFSALYPEKAQAIHKIEPVIFTYTKVLPVKRSLMEKAMAEYRVCVGDASKGAILDSYQDYGDARGGREKFIQTQSGRAIYMEHGGIKTMQGHASAALEILDQLQQYRIGENLKVCLLLPIGAGGPIGLSAAMKAFRQNATAVMVQTERWGAFVRSLESGKMEENDSSLSPFTVSIMENGVEKKIVYEDGISVDGPESEETLLMAKKYLDGAIFADPKRALNQAAPLLLADIIEFYVNQEPVVGGTTAILADALLTNLSQRAIKEADVIILFGTEGSIDPAIVKHTRKLFKESDFSK